MRRASNLWRRAEQSLRPRDPCIATRRSCRRHFSADTHLLWKGVQSTSFSGDLEFRDGSETTFPVFQEVKNGLHNPFDAGAAKQVALRRAGHAPLEVADIAAKDPNETLFWCHVHSSVPALKAHILEHLDAYQAWEASMAANQAQDCSPAEVKNGLHNPSDAGAATQVALRRAGHAPLEVADIAAKDHEDEQDEEPEEEAE
eukprot:s6043_g1.t1